MTYARKSFALSLAFHALMGSLAFWVLSRTTPPAETTKIPLKIMSFQPVEQRIAVPLPPMVSSPKAQRSAERVPALPPVRPSTSPSTLKPSAQSPAPAVAPTPVSAPSTPAALPKPSDVVQSAPAVPTAQAPQAKPDNTVEKRAFLSSLRSAIQSNLRYPSSARRRGMEGEVGVRFSLNGNGTLGAITILSGEAVFHNAVKAAVASASGIDIPKNLVSSMPMEIDLILEFRLKNG
ncbi:TonB family protein [Sulfuricurvum sp. IAE1]|uniref:TonB family protein n=1 Tax=Sulfuricurvum sp. IAE1 TaxID=2546102 RepID=UPI001404AF78|nr:TonB family protein [Sulfuricurvum sp. IAE1]